MISGIVPLWASEIEPFPIRVTTKRLPNMKHIGNISELNGAEIAPVDIITFGSPCQDLSVAGKRAGLDGSKSSLFYEAIRIVKEMRDKTNGKYPRFIVWENVPGAFSSNKGEDFRAVLEEICKIKGEYLSIPRPKKWQKAGEIMGNDYSVAWRQLDAQFWGVPQRRKRIYLVADLADKCAGKILFKSEGLSGYSAKGFKSWQRIAGSLEKGTKKTSKSILKMKKHLHTPKTLTVRCGCEGGGKGALIQENKSATLGCNNNQALFVPKAYVISNSIKSFKESETSRCLDSMGGNPACNQGGMAVVDRNNPSYGIGKGTFSSGYNSTYGFSVTEELEPTMTAAGANAVGQPVYSSSKASFFTLAERELANTLVATDYKEPPLINDKDDAEYIVRRLTPTECARLQGFPDWWCSDLGTEEPSDEEIAHWKRIFDTHAKALGKKTKSKSDNQIRKWLKNPHSDSAEYKMWGNGVALPNVVFVLSGIAYYAKQGCDPDEGNSETVKTALQ